MKHAMGRAVLWVVLLVPVFIGVIQGDTILLTASGCNASLITCVPKQGEGDRQEEQRFRSWLTRTDST